MSAAQRIREAVEATDDFPRCLIVVDAEAGASVSPCDVFYRVACVLGVCLDAAGDAQRLTVDTRGGGVRVSVVYGSKNYGRE